MMAKKNSLSPEDMILTVAESVPTVSNLDSLMKELAKKGYNVKMASDIKDDPKVRTGLMALDEVLGGGIAVCEGGHRIEFFGGESSCKSTFALFCIKRFQELNKKCCYIDAERSFDTDWATHIGVDCDKLLVVTPETLEQFGDIVTVLINEMDLIVVDSIVTMIAETETERDTNEATMGTAARVNALITRKIYHASSKSKCATIFINQLREKIGVLYGSPNTTGGGHALKHLYNTRVEFRAGKPIMEKEERIGIEINLKNVKNKRGKPNNTAIVDFYLEGRIDNIKTMFYQGVKHAVILKSGGWYEFDGVKMLGEENFCKALTPAQLQKLEDEIWKLKGK